MLGALEFDASDDQLIVERLVYDIDPIALVHDPKRSPGLAAHVFFMCIRYLDHRKEFERLQLMMESYIKAVDSTVQVWAWFRALPVPKRRILMIVCTNSRAHKVVVDGVRRRHKAP